MVCEESIREARKEMEQFNSFLGQQRDGADEDIWRGYATQNSNHEDVFIAQLHRRACLLNAGFHSKVQ